MIDGNDAMLGPDALARIAAQTQAELDALNAEQAAVEAESEATDEPADKQGS